MRRARHVGAFLLGLALSACTPTSVDGSGYDLTEFAVSGPATLAAGEASLTVSNSGEFAHTLVVADETGRVVAATDLIESGETAALEVALDPGTYQFTCRIVTEIPDGSIVDHYEAGMHLTVAVDG